MLGGLIEDWFAIPQITARTQGVNEESHCRHASHHLCCRFQVVLEVVKMF